MRMLQVVSQFICACAIVLWSVVCGAQADTPVEVSWESPKNCPQQAEVEQQLNALLATSSSKRTTNPFQAHGAIEESEGRYRLTLSIVRNSTQGTRIIEADDCRSFAKAAAVILVLLVQKEKTLGRELSENELSGQPEPEPAPPETIPPRPAQPIPLTEPSPPRALSTGSASTRSWHFLLRAPEATIDFTTLSQTGYGLGLGVGIVYRAWRASIGGTYYELAYGRSPGDHPYRVQYRRQSLNLVGCYGWRSGLVELAPCAGLTANRVAVHASGENLVSRDQAPIWISIGSGISGYLHLHRHTALAAMATSQLTTNRARILVETPIGIEQAQRIPLLAFGVSIACEWIF